MRFCRRCCMPRRLLRNRYCKSCEKSRPKYKGRAFLCACRDGVWLAFCEWLEDENLRKLKWVPDSIDSVI